MADAIDARRARTALIVGGSALIAAAVLPQPLEPLMLGLAGMPGLWSGVFAGGLAVVHAFGLTVLALGIRGSGSVTGRRPVGTIALIALGLWGVVGAIVSMTPLLSEDPPAGSVPAGGMTFATVSVIVSFALALVACVEIMRAGAVPSPWHRVPLWCLAVLTVLWLVQTLMGVTLATYQGDAALPGATPIAIVLAVAISAAGTIVSVGLGVLAVALGAAAGAASIHPRPAPSI